MGPPRLFLGTTQNQTITWRVRLKGGTLANQTKQKSGREASTKASYGCLLPDRPNRENCDFHGFLVLNGASVGFV